MIQETTTKPRLSWPARYVPTGKRPASLEECSNLWLALEQMAHGPLTVHEVAELLDIDLTTALKRISWWVVCRYIRRVTCDEVPTRPTKPPPEPKPRPESWLNVMRRHAADHGTFTIDDFARVSGKDRHCATSFTSDWVRRGHVVRVAPGVYAMSVGRGE